MATIAFALAATALAPELGLAAGTLGASAFITGASGLGSLLDSYLFAPHAKSTHRYGPRLSTSTTLTSIEGDPILRTAGRCRVSGTIIWAARLKEHTKVTKEKASGGKGHKPATSTTTSYSYSCSFAVGICEGPITSINRIWADGKIMDLSNISYRIYLGDQTQEPDDTIVAIEGADSTPGYRGLAYIVFEDLPLEAYGNRMPQLSFEIWTPLAPAVPDISSYSKGMMTFMYDPINLRTNTTTNTIFVSNKVGLDTIRLQGRKSSGQLWFLLLIQMQTPPTVAFPSGQQFTLEVDSVLMTMPVGPIAVGIQWDGSTSTWTGKIFVNNVDKTDSSSITTFSFIKDLDSGSITTTNVMNRTLDGSQLLLQSSNIAGAGDSHYVIGGLTVNNNQNFQLVHFWLDVATSFAADLATQWSKFFDGSNAPIDLGTDGSLTTGKRPMIYLPYDTSQVGRNTGTLIDLNQYLFGTITNATSIPSSGAYQAVGLKIGAKGTLWSRSDYATNSSLEQYLAGVLIGDGQGEYAYNTGIVTSKTVSNGGKENVTNDLNTADGQIALTQLVGALPNLVHYAISPVWYGDDLRAGSCTIKPKVTSTSTVITSTGTEWYVTDTARAAATVVTSDSTGKVMRGTPADESVWQLMQPNTYKPVASIALMPTIVMDIAPGNTLPDPYSNNAAGVGQGAYPSRKKITVSPAAGFTGTVDKTATAATQVAAFFGTAAVANFGVYGQGTGNHPTVPYSGPAEWSYRRFILHYAKMFKDQGFGQAGSPPYLFYIGCGIDKLLSARSAATTFPAVAAMKTLAADVASMFGTSFTTGLVKIIYAADWDTWNVYNPNDGSGDVLFYLDPLWSDNNISCIGINNYFPLSDWRDDPTGIDEQLYSNSYDPNYLQANIEGGEGFTYKYTSVANRVAQTRTTIVDADPANEPWVFRNKDLRNWWTNTHHDRPLGVRNVGTTSWAAKSKPFVFAQIGCPAINKATNQPSVTINNLSVESALPYFSSGSRDDYVQRAYISAQLAYWRNGDNNPCSNVYLGPMIDMYRSCMSYWDTRPFPSFPNKTSLWRDSYNYQYGYHLTGRLGQCALADLVSRLAQNLGVTVDTSQLYGMVIGYVLERVMSARDAIDPLFSAFFFDPYVSGGAIRFRHRGYVPDWTITDTQLIPLKTSGSEYQLFQVARVQDVELPGRSSIKYSDEAKDFQQAVVYQRRLIGASDVQAESTIGLTSIESVMQQACDISLMDAWLQRESVNCIFPPSFLAMDAADVISLTLNGITQQYRVEDVDYAFSRSAKLTRTDRGLYTAISTPLDTTIGSGIFNTSVQPVPSTLTFVEVPLTSDDQTFYGPCFAITSSPWVANAIYQTPSSDYDLDQVVTTPTAIGTINGAVAAGPEDVYDMGTTITVTMGSADDVLASTDEISLFAGANLAAIKTIGGGWEIIQYLNASLVSGNQYTLTSLLRARLGTEVEMNTGIADGATFVLLRDITRSSIGIAFYNILLNWQWGPNSRPIGDATYTTGTYTPTMISLRPYSPVHLAASKDNVTADITLTWIRRTRLLEQGDSWDVAEAPLGEQSESYDVEIYNGGTVVRTFAGLTSPTVVYTSAMQTTDFGGSQTSIKFEVYQNSATYGRGSGRVANFATLPAYT